MGCGVAGVGSDGHFKGRTCFVKLALTSVQHRQVVVRLRQLGVVLRDLRKSCNRFNRFTGFGLNHAF